MPRRCHVTNAADAAADATSFFADTAFTRAALFRVTRLFERRDSEVFAIAYIDAR